MKQYVIIGNGVAAVGCIEGIRSTDPAGRITVISEEKHAVYCRPLISYYLEGKTDLDRMNYRPADFYEQNKCTVLYGQKAVKIDQKAKQVITDRDVSVPYDAVCIATGSSPFVPRFEGLDTVKQKYTFMTLDDTLALEQAIGKDSRVLIVGAGLIGLKCAEGLYGRVAQITVCDLADRVLSSILDSTCAGMVQKRLEENGIAFLLSDTAVRFEGNRAFMKSGRTPDFDVLVLAVGVRANTSLAADAGAEVGRGIIVSDRMQTTLPDLYAAGDCTEGMDLSLGKRRVLAILPNAYMQGRCAGINMAGGNATFDKAIPMNSIGFFGLHTMTAGSYFPEQEGGACFEEQTGEQLKRLYTKDGRLTGFMLVGATERAGIYTSLIREQVPLDSLDFGILKKIATSAAFLPENRRKMFGGVV